MEITLLLLGILVGVHIVSFTVQAVLWRRLRVAQAAREIAFTHLSLTVESLARQLVLVGQTAVPLSLAFQALLVKELTHYHTPAVDALLAKLGPPFLLTSAEENVLLEALRQRERDMGAAISESEREAAHILPAVIRRVQRELAALPLVEAPLVQLVTILPALGEEGPL